MNLPAHGTTSPDLSIESPLKKQHTQSRNLQHYRLTQSQVPPGKINAGRLAIQATSPGARFTKSSYASPLSHGESNPTARRPSL